jgi:hypothetical protein
MAAVDLPAGATRRASTRDASLVAAGDASPGQPARRVLAGGPRVEERRCAWCERPIPAGKRRDAKTCGQPCRQALHRFRVGRAPGALDRPMRFAYADPPYPGLARRYYGTEEVDHAELVARLVAGWPDGWALSTSAVALDVVLRLCPPGTRVCAWVHGPRGARSRTALSAWEPLLVWGGRPRREAVAEDLHDVLVWRGRQHSHPGALVGMKPAAFCEWVFRLLGARQGDELADLFPGSGAVTRAWQLYASPEARDASPRGRRDGSAPSRLTTATGRLLELAA